MKELEKTKNISVATVLTILVILVGVLSYKQPDHSYTESVEETLNNLVTSEFMWSQADVSDSVFLVDVRSGFEYARGHIEQAINISLPDLLSKKNVELIREAADNNKTILFYSDNINDALSAKMIIDQLGYAKSKVLSVSLDYDQDKLIVSESVVEKSPEDIQAFIDKSVQDAKANKIVISKPVPKQIVPKKKKKKMPVEGGC